MTQINCQPSAFSTFKRSEPACTGDEPSASGHSTEFHARLGPGTILLRWNNKHRLHCLLQAVWNCCWRRRFESDDQAPASPFRRASPCKRSTLWDDPAGFWSTVDGYVGPHWSADPTVVSQVVLSVPWCSGKWWWSTLSRLIWCVSCWYRRGLRLHFVTFIYHVDQQNCHTLRYPHDPTPRKFRCFPDCTCRFHPDGGSGHPLVKIDGTNHKKSASCI